MILIFLFQEKNVDKVVSVMNEELKNIITWLNVNKLKLNVKKTQFTVFSSGRRKYQLKNKLFINNEEINITHHTKFLEITVDDQLNWTDYVNYTKMRLQKESV